MLAFGGEDVIAGPRGAETDPSAGAFSELADDDLGAALVDSERAGQESAPITGPASIEPLVGRFQAAFLPWAATAAASPLLSALSDQAAASGVAAVASNRSGYGIAAAAGEEREAGATWDRGEEGWLRAAARPERGEWMLGGGSEPSDMGG